MDSNLLLIKRLTEFYKRLKWLAAYLHLWKLTFPHIP